MKHRQTYSVVLADAGRLLMLLADGPLPVSELCRRMGFNRSKVNRWVTSLAEAGVVIQTLGPNWSGTGAPSKFVQINPHLIGAAAIQQARSSLIEKLLS